MTRGCTAATRIEGGARHEGGCEAPALGGGSGAARPEARTSFHIDQCVAGWAASAPVGLRGKGCET